MIRKSYKNTQRSFVIKTYRTSTNTGTNSFANKSYKKSYISENKLQIYALITINSMFHCNGKMIESHIHIPQQDASIYDNNILL